MEVMFHLRLLNDRREILGWTRVAAESRGDGCFWAKQHFVFEAEADGVGTAVNVHWPEVHVHLTLDMPQPIQVSAGKVFTIPLTQQPLLRIQSEALPMPPITIRTSQVIGVATGPGR